MAIDPRQLRPTELVRLLNSTPLGEVISDRQLLRHRGRAGFRIGNDRQVDLFRYVAWLVAVRHEPQAEDDSDPYESLKERARARNAALSLAGRDIGENHALADGTILRPRLAVIDDPQTTESAWSLTQSKQREAILSSDILGMAGPGQKIAAIMCCTVNYLTGANTVLGIDGLTGAETAFMDLCDSDGKPLDIMPSICLVPTALSAMGTQLWRSLEVRDTTASTKYPVANPHQGKFRVEVSRYLSNSCYTGNSSKAWYLLADPNDLPVIEVAFLNGQEAPTIETAEADFSVLGIQMRGYHDFGRALQDPRGGVKSAGQ